MSDPVRYLDGERGTFAATLLRSAERDGPTERSWQRALAAAGVAGAATTATATGTAAGAIARWALFKWIGVGALAGGAVAVGVPYAARHDPPPDRAPVTLTAPASTNTLDPIPNAAAALAPAAPEAEQSSLRSEWVQRRPALRAVAPSDPPTPAPSPKEPTVAPSAGDTLSRELAGIDSARRQLAAGDPRGAIAGLDAYRTEFPQGHFFEEAALLHAECLASLGDCASVRALVDARARSGGSVFGRRWATLGKRCSP